MGEPLWNWLPWEHFVENQCRGRRGRDRKSNLVEVLAVRRGGSGCGNWVAGVCWQTVEDGW